MIINKIIQIYIIIYFINLLKHVVNLQIIDQYSKWNEYGKNIFEELNITTNNSDIYSLNLTNSNLYINRNTSIITILDDNNHRILIFNRSNLSKLFLILFDLSHITNYSMINSSLSTITYDNKNSIYISDGWNKQIKKINNTLEYGINSTFIMNWTMSSNNSLLNINVSGLCIDNIDQIIYITDYDYHRIIRYEQLTSNISIYIGNRGIGNASDQLNRPTSIVINDNRTLFVNDVGNNRIQVFKYNVTNGTSLPINISNCIGLSLYSSNILIINTKTSVYLFNLINNQTTCIIGCNNSILNNIHNAIIDNQGNLIVSQSNFIYEYIKYQENPNDKIFFNPKEKCSSSGKFGINCSFSKNICDLSKPCINSIRCTENTTNDYGYICECMENFSGTNCEIDERPCRPSFCFDRGNCTNNTLNGQYKCQCNFGYEGEQCELKSDFCLNITCQNDGVCFREYLNYTCQCLPGFTGRHCEIFERNAIVHIYISKSFGYIAILMVASLIGFIIIMDILKYVVNIDPVQPYRNISRKGYCKTKKKIQIIHRAHYVN